MSRKKTMVMVEYPTPVKNDLLHLFLLIRFNRTFLGHFWDISGTFLWHTGSNIWNNCLQGLTLKHWYQLTNHGETTGSQILSSGHFLEENRYSASKHCDKIYNQESSTTILVAKVRKSPNIYKKILRLDLSRLIDIDPMSSISKYF